MLVQATIDTAPRSSSPRVQALLQALDSAPATPEPPAPSFARRCAAVLSVWALMVAVALAIALQFDPMRSGTGPVSPWFAIPAGFSLAFVTTWFAFGYIILIRESRNSFYLPGESKWLLSRRDRRYLDRLRSVDPELDRAVSQWLLRGRVFGVAQLSALAEASASPSPGNHRGQASAVSAMHCPTSGL